MLRAHVDAFGKVNIAPPNCCNSSSIGSYWPEENLPLLVKVNDPLLTFLTQQAIVKLNEAIGKEVLKLKAPSTENKKNSIVIEISFDRHISAHGYTLWDPKWNICIPGKVQPRVFKKKIKIELKLKLKDHLPLRQKTFEYYSTLTHEIIHCLGMGHFPAQPEFRPEIMFPRVGGTCIPKYEKEIENLSVEEFELPPLKKSPITFQALQWCYKNPETKENTETKETKENTELNNRKRMPIYCKSCKQIGWLNL